MAGTPPASANVAHRKQTLTGANVLHGLAWPPKVERGARLADYDLRGPRLRLSSFCMMSDPVASRIAIATGHLFAVASARPTGYLSRWFGTMLTRRAQHPIEEACDHAAHDRHCAVRTEPTINPIHSRPDDIHRDLSRERWHTLEGMSWEDPPGLGK
jgi:hypothetical protein